MRASRMALVLASGALAASALDAVPAHADEATCRGRSATIIGEPGGTVTGTDGADVIATNGATEVDTGKGDDTICVTATAARVRLSVDSGPGADVVDTTAVRAFTSAVLGEGSDEFHGGGGQDWVAAGTLQVRDADTDRVETGGAYDSVLTGQANRANPDEIDLGAGPGSIQLNGRSSTGFLRAAAGSSATIDVDLRAAGEWVLDDRAGAATRNDVPAFTWENLHINIVYGRPRAHVRYVGTDGDDSLYLSGHLSGVALGAGRDQVRLGPTGGVSGTFDGGPGRDLLQIESAEVLADLASGEFGTHLNHADARIESFEDVRVKDAVEARLHGTPGPNAITFAACTARVRAGAGADTIVEYLPSSLVDCSTLPRPRRDTWEFGGPGDDRLRGNGHRDHLVGGPGRDRADGRGGRDVCRAEIVENCEA